MKQYIKPISDICTVVETDLIMVSVTDPTGATVIPGGGSVGDGSGISIGAKGRGRYAAEYDEEDDPILHLLIDQEEGNTSGLW